MPSHHVQPPEWIDAAPIRVEESVEISAPPSVVWAHVADHVHWPEWFTDLDKVEVTGAATGVGGKRRVTAKLIRFDEEFTVWDEDEQFSFAVVHTNLLFFLSTMVESVRIDPTDGGCRVVYSQGLQAIRGFGWLLGLAWRGAPGQVQRALANLKQLSES